LKTAGQANETQVPIYTLEKYFHKVNSDCITIPHAGDKIKASPSTMSLGLLTCYSWLLHNRSATLYIPIFKEEEVEMVKETRRSL